MISPEAQSTPVKESLSLMCGWELYYVYGGWVCNFLPRLTIPEFPPGGGGGGTSNLRQYVYARMARVPIGQFQCH